jgi:hypothetical protein
MAGTVTVNGSIQRYQYHSSCKEVKEQNKLFFILTKNNRQSWGSGPKTDLFHTKDVYFQIFKQLYTILRNESY